MDFNTSPVPGTVRFFCSTASGRALRILNVLHSVFETTIRWVGGLLSAYELSNKQHPILLEKAKEVADKMAFAWIGVRSLLVA